MKFFHLSDLHIGLRLLNHDLREDQEYILDQIIRAAEKEQPDAVVIAGDIYDRPVPSAEAVELFDRFVTELVRAVPDAEIMMISGNHDSASRINMFRSVLEHQKIHMVGVPPLTDEEHIAHIALEDEFGKVHFYLLPFVRPAMVRMTVGSDENGNLLSYSETVRRLVERENVDEEARNVFVSHQFYLPAGTDAADVERMDSEIRTVGDIDEVKADILDRFDYAALGHIHKPMTVGSDTVRYCGTPLACSVSEAGQQKGILEVTLREKGNVGIRTIPLTPLRNVAVIKGELGEVLSKACDDYASVILTDKADLDVFDMQDRLHAAFPHLLEIRREGAKGPDYQNAATPEKEMDAFSLCCSFLGETDEEEKALIRDVLNAAGEVM